MKIKVYQMADVKISSLSIVFLFVGFHLLYKALPIWNGQFVFVDLQHFDLIENDFYVVFVYVERSYMLHSFRGLLVEIFDVCRMKNKDLSSGLNVIKNGNQ